ncbi:MAG: serine/threonine-protein kinase [Ktedonobacteraceae bacterium]
MTDRVGQRFGDYRLTRFIGRGGFGDVYLGQHTMNNTLAAIKLMETRLDADDLKLFIQETSTIFRMKHPRIVQMLDFGISSDGIPFLAMAYAPNGTLRQRHPKGTSLPLATVVSYITPIANALQFVHDQKRVHCDVKPENILLGPRNELWLSDFGISIVSRTSSLRSPSSITGTALYMAPEQFRGRPEPASDQYALAAIIYEWLSGAPPFTQGDFIQLGYQHAHEPVPPLRDKVSNISPDIEQVIMTALAKEPGQRFGSVRFGESLRLRAGTSCNED